MEPGPPCTRTAVALYRACGTEAGPQARFLLGWEAPETETVRSPSSHENNLQAGTAKQELYWTGLGGNYHEYEEYQERPNRHGERHRH